MPAGPRGSGSVGAARGPVQPVPTKAPLRYWLTAASGTRKERPTRIASSSPEWTSRYTVIFDTRMIKATSATVRNLTSLRGVSLAIVLPLPYEAEHLTGFGAPVTYVSRVSLLEKRATPSKASLLLLLVGNAPAAALVIIVPVLSCFFRGNLSAVIS